MMRAVALVLILTSLAACETVKGVGRDVTSAGQALDNTF
ncbi:entericidin A/B family lipoprotein [Rhodobacteraceae bacterium 2CG4]|uniref:Entericidin A/B family lipoprotein n=1 Tax=Halovulum marinum TaxID=2662447 RepID=A0A6L5Z3K9_9RHOB|nr:entericidin A/B family lipoprotein [Halovulum marinum]MSU91136.1 entericidin A/B family lipoprotein [Halovulum marinum]